MNRQRLSERKYFVVSLVAVITSLTIFVFIIASAIFLTMQNWEQARGSISLAKLLRRLKASKHLQESVTAYQRKDFSEAEKKAKDALKVDPTYSEARRMLIILLVRKEKFSEAEKLAEKEKNKKFKVDDFLLIAEAYNFLGNFSKSENLYRKVIALDPDNAVALNNYGYMLAERGEKLNEAKKMILKAVKLQPNEPAFIDSLGWVYYKEGEFQKAKPLLEKAAKGDPNNAEIRYHLGMVYLHLGDLEKAKQELQHAVKLAPNYQDAKKALEKLQQIEFKQKMKGASIRT